MKDPKEEQWYFINITDIGPSSVSYFDVHDFDIYSIFVCVLYDSEINTNNSQFMGNMYWFYTGIHVTLFDRVIETLNLRLH